ncbi:MAG: hypothetical protein V1678_00605 [Candidatus Aenigmatarchaeota archaeon]
MIIEKMNSDKIDSALQRIIEMSTNLRAIEEELESIDKNLSDINLSYLSGKVSEEFYNNSKDKLNKRRRVSIDKINKAVNEMLAISEPLPETISKFKL